MGSKVSMMNTTNVMFLWDVTLAQSECGGGRFLQNIFIYYQTPRCENLNLCWRVLHKLIPLLYCKRATEVVNLYIYIKDGILERARCEVDGTETTLRNGRSSVQLLAGGQRFSVLYNLQIGSGTSLISCSAGTGSGRVVKLATHLHTRPRLRITETTLLVPHYLHGLYRGKCTYRPGRSVRKLCMNCDKQMESVNEQQINISDRSGEAYTAVRNFD